jgi:hypothetical protein
MHAELEKEIDFINSDKGKCNAPDDPGTWDYKKYLFKKH